MSEPDIELTPECAIEACELFLQGIKSDFGTDNEGMVPLSKAIDVLRTAFETIQFRENPAGS